MSSQAGRKPPEVRIVGVAGLPEIAPNDDIAALVVEAAAAQGTPLVDGDVIVVTQKVVSKAEGRLVELRTVEPSAMALEYARRWGKDARQVEVVLREASRIVRMDRGVLIVETRHGFVCANAGVDASNTGRPGFVTLLPEDPDASAERIRNGITETAGAAVSVIIADSFGRPWREGIDQVALGVAGLLPLRDYTGQADPDGYQLRVTQVALADEIAAAAELVMGKLDRVPVAIVRGCVPPPGTGSGRQLLREPEKDLFR
jgi:coenzyme F420-0:L-glutamate ligase / coenzyme F420-1:gamma-L-glutamate ligase